MKKAIFWDFDGTLVVSNSLWSTSILAALRQLDPDTAVTLPQIRKYTKTGFTWNAPDNDHRQLVGERWWSYTSGMIADIYRQCGISEPLARAASQRQRQLVMERERYWLYADAPWILQKVRQAGWENHLLSNHVPELNEIIEKMGLASYFTTMTISAQEGYDKPRQELFEIALERAGHPDCCWMVGDNPKADGMGGRAAGMRTALVHTVVPDTMQTEVDLVVSRLEELTAIFSF